MCFAEVNQLKYVIYRTDSVNEHTLNWLTLLTLAKHI